MSPHKKNNVVFVYIELTVVGIAILFGIVQAVSMFFS